MSAEIIFNIDSIAHEGIQAVILDNPLSVCWRVDSCKSEVGRTVWELGLQNVV